MDFTGAFAGTSSWKGRYATPYESVFTSEEGLLFQDSYHEVYRLYRQNSVTPLSRCFSTPGLDALPCPGRPWEGFGLPGRVSARGLTMRTRGPSSQDRPAMPPLRRTRCRSSPV